jgi:hypothetical protein
MHELDQPSPHAASCTRDCKNVCTDLGDDYSCSGTVSKRNGTRAGRRGEERSGRDHKMAMMEDTPGWLIIHIPCNCEHNVHACIYIDCRTMMMGEQCMEVWVVWESGQELDGEAARCKRDRARCVPNHRQRNRPSPNHPYGLGNNADLFDGVCFVLPCILM